MRIASCVSASTPGVTRTMHAAHARLGRAPGLVERVEDDERACLGRRAQLLVRLVVPVHEQPVALDPGAARERELTQRGHVRAEPFLGEQAHQRDVRERLRPVDDERVRNGPLEHPRALAQRVLGVDDERRAEPLRQLGHGQFRRAPARPPRPWFRRGTVLACAQ